MVGNHADWRIKLSPEKLYISSLLIMTLTEVKKINFIFGNREFSSVSSRQILNRIDNSIFNIKLLEKMTDSKYQQYLKSQSMSEIHELSPEQIHLHLIGKICLRGKRNSITSIGVSGNLRHKW